MSVFPLKYANAILYHHMRVQATLGMTKHKPATRRMTSMKPLTNYPDSMLNCGLFTFWSHLTQQ